MVRVRRAWVIALLTAALAGRTGRAQMPDGVPASSPKSPLALGAPPPGWGPIGPGLPVPQGPVPLEDRNGSLLAGDPILDGPPGAPPGWLAAVDVDPLGPHIKNRLSAAVPTPAGTDTVHLPTADLAWTVAPCFELGYRFPEGTGALLLSYRFVEASGSATIAAFDPSGGPAALRSRLDVNVLDVDYSSHELSLGPGWDMTWLVGVRVASLYFDSEAASPALAQHETNHFAGAGPHVGLELWRCLGDSGLALFGRADAAFLFGPIHETFAETTAGGAGQTTMDQRQGLPVLSVDAGLGWTPAGSGHVRFAAGYHFERWWNAARDGDSHGELWLQGVFVRGEWRY
jgi:hypothetical protein